MIEVTLEDIMNEVHQRDEYLKSTKQLRSENLRHRKGTKPQCTKCGGRKTRKHAKGKTGYCYGCDTTFRYELVVTGFTNHIEDDVRQILIGRGFGEFPFPVNRTEDMEGKKMIEYNGRKVGCSFFTFA